MVLARCPLVPIVSEGRAISLSLASLFCLFVLPFPCAVILRAYGFGAKDLSLFRADATFALQGDDAPSPLAPRAQNGNAILILQNDRQ